MRSRLGVFITVTLAALLTLTACLNPISVVFPENTSGGVASPSPKTAGGGTSTGIPGGEPFTLDVWVESPDDADRSGTGPTGGRIRENSTEENGWSGIRNVVQLVVVDDETGEIVDFQEVRKGSDNQETTTLVVTGLTYGSTYKFLMLMGHKNRDYAVSGVAYTSDSPTLLAAGFKSQSVSRGQKVSITMYPVVVDTKFTSEGVPVEAVLEGKLLQSAAWNIAWKVTGLQTLKAADPNGDIFAEARPVVWDRDNDAGAWAGISPISSIPLPAVNDYGVMEITLNVSAYDRIENRNSANFNVEYAPFNSLNWGENTNNKPVWIIRNGINDAPQNAYTSFASGTTWGGGAADYNGNGAVTFSVKPSFYVSSTGNDSWAGTSPQPFATLAAAYPAALNDTVRKQITFLSDLDAGDNPVLLNPPSETADEEITIASDVVRRELTRMGNADSSEAHGSPYFGPSVVRVEGGAKVVFQDIAITGGTYRGLGVYGGGNMVTLNNTEISGKASYEILDRFTDVYGGGVLLSNSADPPSKITMNGGSIYGEDNLYGKYNVQLKIHGYGVAIKNDQDATDCAEFEMNGGTIYGKATTNEDFGAYSSGGGVYNYGGTFTMTDATIYGDGVHDGGGVYIRNGGSFTMYGASRVSGGVDSDVGLGGGVYLYDGTFTMNDYSTINGSSAFWIGGGVFILSYPGASFTMNDHSTVSGNTAKITGGGVYHASGSTQISSFKMNDDSAVSGNTAGEWGGGVYIEDGIELWNRQPVEFEMHGNSFIYGSDEADETLQNTAPGGAAMYHKYHFTLDDHYDFEVLTPINVTVNAGNYLDWLEWEPWEP